MAASKSTDDGLEVHALLRMTWEQVQDAVYVGVQEAGFDGLRTALDPIMRNPPIGRACRKKLPWANVFSESTQISIGSLSPSMPLSPVRC